MPPLRRLPLALTLVALLLLAACGGGGPGDRQPSSSISADPPSGTARAPVTVTFSAPEGAGEETTYRWFVDGVPAGTGATVDHTFEAAGRFEIRLEVDGGSGNTSATLDYTVLSDSAFDIVLVFEEGSFTAQQRSMIEAAARRWEQLVVGDIPDDGTEAPFAGRGCLSILGPVPGTIPPELQHVDYVDDLLVYVYSVYE